MQSESGISAFVDNEIVLSCARFGANVDAFDEGHWMAVSRSVWAALRHPQCDADRAALCHVDWLMFTPAICHQRARYALWRVRRQQDEKKKKAQPTPSGFNILVHSMKDDVQALMDAVKAKLPSTLAVSNDDDDDDEGPIEIFRPPHIGTEEEMAADAERARAEDELFERIQLMQLEHFKKYKRWVEVPLMDTPQKERTAASAKELSSITIAELEQLLDKLGIVEHASKFRRTTGQLLVALSETELRARFAGDCEAADILWHYVQDHRAPQEKEPSAIGKLYTTAKAPSDDVRAASSALSQYERYMMAKPTQTQLRDSLARGEIDVLKRALNPSRPLRPSQEPQHSPEKMSSPDKKKLLQLEKEYVAKVRGHVDPAPVESHVARAEPTSVPPPRANRWAVVDYDDADDDDTDVDEDE